MHRKPAVLGSESNLMSNALYFYILETWHFGEVALVKLCGCKFICCPGKKDNAMVLDLMARSPMDLPLPPPPVDCGP